MNRRKFIKKGLQLGGAGLISSTLGCQGSWIDTFDVPAEEVLVAERTGNSLYKMNLATGQGQLICTIANLYGLALYDLNTLLLTEQGTAGGALYRVNLNDNSVQLLLSGFGVGNSLKIVMENSSSALVGDNAGRLYRINLASLAVSTLATGLGTVSGIAVENSSSALVQSFSTGNLFRVSLMDGSYGGALILQATNTFSHLALAPNRNIAYISNALGNQIKRFDLSTNSLLSDIGPTNAGESIELENSSSVLVGVTTTGEINRVDLDTGASSRIDNGFLGANIPIDFAVRFQ